MKYCKDCKHFKASWIQLEVYSRCLHPAIATPDPISGKPKVAFASIERRSRKPCGTDATLFEAKNRKTSNS